jgi:glycosyltransferase involved in cell wall biosynthesis
VKSDAAQKKARVALIADCVPETAGAAALTPGGIRSISLACALADLGFEVVVFSRGKGQEQFFSGRPGIQIEILPSKSRTARREDKIADIESEAEWLEEQLANRAAAEGQQTWQLFELIISEGWRAGLLAERLLCRWRARLVAQAAERMLAGVAQEQLLEKTNREGCDIGLGEAPAYFLGKLLLNAEGSPATALLQRARTAAMKFSRLRGSEGGTEADQLMGAVASALAESRDRLAPQLQEFMVAETLGQSLLEINPVVAQWLERECELIDRHVWISDLHRLKEECGRAAHRRCQEEKLFRQVICDRAGAFIVSSNQEAEMLLAVFRVPWEQMFFLAPGVEENFASAAGRRAELDDFLAGAGADGSFFAGRLVTLEYGPAWAARHKEMVLEAFSFAVRERPDLALVMVGGGEEYKKLQAMRESRDELRSRVLLVEDLPAELAPALFSRADVFVSASELESDGWALVQAAAAAKAIVCSENQPLAVKAFSPEAVVVPAGEIFDLVRGLLDLLENRENLEKRGRLLAEKAARLDMRAQARSLLAYLAGRGFRINLPAGQ